MEKLQEVIGQNVARFRQQRGLNQRQLGDLMEQYTGQKWERQSVWSAERGQRAWAAADLVGLARALDVTIGDLMATKELNVLVGDVPTSAQEVGRRASAGDEVAFAEAWQRYLNLEGLCNILRQVENEARDARADVLRDVAAQPRIRAAIEERLSRYRETAEAEAREQAASERGGPYDVSTERQLRKFMHESGYLDRPVIRAAMFALGKERRP